MKRQKIIKSKIYKRKKKSRVPMLMIRLNELLIRLNILNIKVHKSVKEIVFLAF